MTWTFIDHPAWYYAVSSSMIGIKMFLPYVWATRKDPGVLKADPDLDFIELL
jgi:DHHC palmitoyltransferase